MPRLFSLLFGLGLLLSSAAPALAQEFFEIDSFQATLQLQEDGSMLVTERIVADFTQPRHGLFRSLDTQGIQVQVLGVTDASGKDWPYHTTEGEGVLEIRIGDPEAFVAERQVYEIRYRVQNAIHTVDSPLGLNSSKRHDELYWDVTGNEWPVRIRQASATVELPTAALDGSEEFAYNCVTGSYQSDMGACEHERRADSVAHFKTTSALQAYEGLTIMLGLPTGKLKLPSLVAVRPSPSPAEIRLDGEPQCNEGCELFLAAGPHRLEIRKWGHAPFAETIQVVQGESLMLEPTLKPFYWLWLLQGLFILLLAAIAFRPIHLFWKKGLDPKGRGTIVPQYESPDGMAPAEMGALYDERVHLRDLTSTLIDLCVRGHMKIKVLPKAQGLLFKKDDYELIRVRNGADKEEGLSEFERRFMKYIFQSSGHRTLSSLQKKFYVHLPILKEMLYRGLVEKGYMLKSPDKVRRNYFAKAFLCLFLAIASGIALPLAFGIPFPLLLSLALAINAILTFIFASFMPQKTEKGQLAYEHVLGFRMYLETAERDRVKFQEKEHLFYEFLPYAMTFGIADKWSQAFEGIYKTPPDWYVGPHATAFSVTDFSHRLGGLSGQMGQAFSSAPQSHSSSGGSGFSGGFSGGGSGGGGGGSW